MGVKFGLPPVAPTDARLFVLGSLPGDVSLAQQRYYAHPTNQFWRLLGAALGEQLQPLPYDDRLAVLARCRVGLWDVIGSASRNGSLDAAIRDAQHNALRHVLGDFPDLRAIAFNGATSAAAGRKLIGDPSARLALIDLPSSSGANTRQFADKAREWAKLGEFAGR